MRNGRVGSRRVALICWRAASSRVSQAGRLHAGWMRAGNVHRGTGKYAVPLLVDGDGDGDHERVVVPDS